MTEQEISIYIAQWMPIIISVVSMIVALCTGIRAIKGVVDDFKKDKATSDKKINEMSQQITQVLKENAELKKVIQKYVDSNVRQPAMIPQKVITKDGK